MSWQFVPNKTGAANEIPVPYFEDARADYAPYYRSKLTLREAQQQVAANMAKLGALVTNMQQGKYVIGQQARNGYMISFVLHTQDIQGANGVIRVAGLPMRSASPGKLDRVLVQALLNVNQWLQTAITSRVFSPDAHPLVPHLLLPMPDGTPGTQTVSEAVVQAVRVGQKLLPGSTG